MPPFGEDSRKLLLKDSKKSWSARTILAHLALGLTWIA